MMAGGFAYAPAAVGQAQELPGADAPGARAPIPDKPNVVMIITDDQRADTLDYMPLVKANLMDHGVTFSDMVAVNPLCCPSRASFLTGTYAHSHGVWKNKAPYSVWAFDKSSHIGVWLKDQGYTTALIGKYFNEFTGQPLGRGWNRTAVLLSYSSRKEAIEDPCQYHLQVDGVDRCYMRKSKNFITYRLSRLAQSFMSDAEEPFFLFWAPTAPHYPAKSPPADQHDFDGIAPWRPESHNEADVSDKPPWLQARPLLDADQIASADGFREEQLESLQAVDRAVDDFVTLLTEKGEMDNTLFIFTSDNGIGWGEHRLVSKQTPYEEALLVPLVIRADWLVAGPGTVDGNVVANIDIAPTISQMTGAVPTLNVEGESLVPLLDGSAGTWREGVGLEHMIQRDVVSFCGYRTEDSSYIAYGDGVQELYDLNADPLQLTNLAANPAYDTIREDLRTKALDICDPPPPGDWNP